MKYIGQNARGSAEFKESFINLSKELIVGTLYGGLKREFPLIKIEDGIIKKLGTRTEYENITYGEDLDKNMKIGKLYIQRVSGSNPKLPSHLSICFFMFSGFENKDDYPVPYFLKLELRSDSGSRWKKVKQNFTRPLPYDTVFKPERYIKK